MFSVDDLRFAQKYPFSSIAKAFVKSSNVSLESVSPIVLERSKAIIHAALNDIEYNPMISSSKTMLEQEVLAYPVSKIIVSFMKDDLFIEKFSVLWQKKVFSDLENEKDDTLLVLGDELGIKWSRPKDESFFVQVSVSTFLLAGFKQDFLKLVNQKVSSGKVFLSRNEFCRLLAFFFEQRLLSELPFDTKNLPKVFERFAKDLSSDFFEKRAKKFENFAFGAVKAEHFPPCFEKLYMDILSGRNLAHMERFSLATFMLSIGMSVKEVVSLYKSTPNFDEKITTYQVTRLAGSTGKKISAPSCEKMKDYGLRMPPCPCNSNPTIRHPVSVYRKNLVAKAKTIA